MKITPSLLPVTCLFVRRSWLLLRSPSHTQWQLSGCSGDKRSWQREREQHTCKMLTPCYTPEGKSSRKLPRREQGTMHGLCLSKQWRPGGKMDVNEETVAADTRLPMSWDEQRRYVLQPSWIKAAEGSNGKKWSLLKKANRCGLQQCTAKAAVLPQTAKLFFPVQWKCNSVAHFQAQFDQIWFLYRWKVNILPIHACTHSN